MIRLFLTLFFLNFLACSSTENRSLERTNEIESKDTLNYFFSGHTYQWRDKLFRVDHRLMELDYTGFDGIWLGGDISAETLLNRCVIEHIDSVFNLESPSTHFAMGNHDARHGNWDWMREFTGRELFYESHIQGVTLLVLSTAITPENCELLDDQFELIQKVCDTISASSHLILMHHHNIWGAVPGLPEAVVYSHGDYGFWNVNCESSGNNFKNSIYPKLLEVKSRGVEVICVLGDAGAGRIERKGASMQSADGIHFLASGINNSGLLPDTLKFKKADPDKVLIFEHIPKKRSLDWGFYSLDSLLESQRAKNKIKE